MSDDKITIGEFRDAGYCVKGQRSMANAIGIDWRNFVKNGLTLEEAAKHSGISCMVSDVLKKRAERG